MCVCVGGGGGGGGQNIPQLRSRKIKVFFTKHDMEQAWEFEKNF